MEKMKMESVNMIEHNIALLGQLFPNCITEEIGKDGKPKLAVNMNNLQQMFGMNSLRVMRCMNLPGLEREPLLLKQISL